MSADGRPSRTDASAADSEADTGASDRPEGAESANPGGATDAPDREASRLGSYALAGLVLAVFLLGLLRLVSPTASGLAVGSLLALFGVAVGLLAVRDRVRGA